jgi:hypothetical protein
MAKDDAMDAPPLFKCTGTGSNNADSLDPIKLWLLDDLTLGRKESDMKILVYRMLRYGMKYVDQGAASYEAQHRQLLIKQIKWKAAKLGFQIVQNPAT